MENLDSESEAMNFIQSRYALSASGSKPNDNNVFGSTVANENLEREHVSANKVCSRDTELCSISKSVDDLHVKRHANYMISICSNSLLQMMINRLHARIVRKKMYATFKIVKYPL